MRKLELKFKLTPPKKKRAYKKMSSEKKKESNIRFIINKIRTGDLDMDNTWHKGIISTALNAGRIQKTEDGYKEVD